MKVVTGEEMHQIDRYTMESIGLQEELLMENAGQALFLALEKEKSVQEANRIAVFIGAGNNGGDGFVVGRLLNEKGYLVDVWTIPPIDRIRGTAKTHANIYQRCGYKFREYQEEYETFYRNINHYDVIVDGLLGTGIRGEVRKPYDEVIAAVNESKAKVFSIDVPSGIPSSTENEQREVLGVKADKTFTLQAPKLTAFHFPYASFYGEQITLDIGIPAAAFQKMNIHRELWDETRVRNSLPKRSDHAHKGDFGRALIIGGSRTMPGAPILTTRACLRAGAGLTTLATPLSVATAAASQAPEAMVHPLANEHEQEEWMSSVVSVLESNRFDGIAIGPGIGRDQRFSIFDMFSGFQGPVIMDADAIHNVAYEKERLKEASFPVVLTPHPGEMAVLTGETVENVEQDRFHVAKAFAMDFGVYLVLKGRYTIVTAPDGKQWINPTGNPSLAKGGSGDILTGAILAFCLQHESIQEALCNAVYIHGYVADQLVECGASPMGLVASDLINEWPYAFR
ncbi:NAD(P)H-hydrate dehydratase [Texcoconibacillus texcoconensis]|uniref:Bifunctional NAD(P)H-hydrate repair enzyme n=1 Tax=Texcoconibacillus texcoconensis TaxID=1095777 RepID=A0A840QSG7_9BACI|nr:NAD(P)H-hydrate dehydratase [Texcoconibacillus texcoconensis]MBB5174217.1 NAD(P)H-hydrate epimerase [Texcoconibacillus texcoconensis]